MLDEEIYLPSEGELVQFWRGGTYPRPAIVIETHYKALEKPLEVWYMCKILCDGVVHIIRHPSLLEPL